MITEALPKNRLNINVNETEFYIYWYRMINTVFSAEEGWGILMREAIKMQQNYFFFDFHQFEAIGIKIKLRNNDWPFLIAVYPSPNCHVECLGELEKI